MQENIILQNNTPSISSMKEGQIVFAKNNQGIDLYTKQGGQLFLTQLRSFSQNPSINLTVDKLKAKHLSYSKFIDYRIFIHNHYDDYMTDKIYLPWGHSSENTESSRLTQKLIPYNMTFKKLLWRPGAVTVDAVYSFRIEYNKNDTANDSVIVALAKIKIGSREDNEMVTLYADDFSIYAPYDDLSFEPDGGGISLSVQATADPGSAIWHHVTSVWEMEVDIS